jgi:hypothetical protein
MTLEAQTIARVWGQHTVHNLEPEDLVALGAPTVWRVASGAGLTTSGQYVWSSVVADNLGLFARLKPA